MGSAIRDNSLCGDFINIINRKALISTSVVAVVSGLTGNRFSCLNFY
jgi:hypothetical protein